MQQKSKKAKMTLNELSKNISTKKSSNYYRFHHQSIINFSIIKTRFTFLKTHSDHNMNNIFQKIA